MGEGEVYMKKVLFLCVHNSGRSQIGEAYLKALGGDAYEVESAGLEPGKLNPFVVRAMAEEGIDISQNLTKSVFDLHKADRRYNIVITVCSPEAAEKCPIFPGLSERLHWPFDDPAALKGTDDEIMEGTRKIRDQIKAAVQEFVQT